MKEKEKAKILNKINQLLLIQTRKRVISNLEINNLLGLEPSLKKQIKADEEEVKTIEDRKPGYINPFPQDADDDGEDDSDKSEKSDEDEKPRKAKSNPDADAESSDSDDDDDDDDNEKLFEEYERIKRERELEQKRKVIDIYEMY